MLSGEYIIIKKIAPRSLEAVPKENADVQTTALPDKPEKQVNTSSVPVDIFFFLQM